MLLILMQKLKVMLSLNGALDLARMALTKQFFAVIEDGSIRTGYHLSSKNEVQEPGRLDVLLLSKPM